MEGQISHSKYDSPCSEDGDEALSSLTSDKFTLLARLNDMTTAIDKYKDDKMSVAGRSTSSPEVRSHSSPASPSKAAAKDPEEVQLQDEEADLNKTCSSGSDKQDGSQKSLQ